MLTRFLQLSWAPSPLVCVWEVTILSHLYYPSPYFVDFLFLDGHRIRTWLSLNPSKFRFCWTLLVLFQHSFLSTYTPKLPTMNVHINVRGGTIYWKILKNQYIGHIDIDIDIEICNFKILISILILKFAFHIYCYQYWYWKNMNIDIGIDIDIGEIKSIFVNFYGIFAGLIYIIFETNFIQLPLWFCQKLESLRKDWIIPLI